jgi:flagellin
LVGFYSAGLSRALSEYNKVSRSYDSQVSVIASGEKKLSGADLTKAARYEAQYRGAGSVKENMLDVIEMVDIADAGLDTIQLSLGKIRGYYLDGTTGTPTVGDIDTAQLNINSEVSAIDEISRETEYNGKIILFGMIDFNVQSGTNNLDSFTIHSQGKGGIDQRGIQIGVNEETGGNDVGTLVEDLGGTGYALDETSVGSTNISSYDDVFYGVTATGTQKIDQMTSNVVRMSAQMGGYRSTASSVFNHMDSFENTMGSALERIKGISFEEELSKLNDLQIRKETISSLISSVNQSNASILSLLP